MPHPLQLQESEGGKGGEKGGGGEEGKPKSAVLIHYVFVLRLGEEEKTTNQDREGPKEKIM